MTSDGFGILEPIHRRALAGAPVGSVRSWVEYAVLPMIPIYLQAYVLVGPQADTRLLRCALCALALAVTWHAWTGWRLVEPELNAFNNGMGIVFLHLGVKSVEFALLKKHINDPYMRRGRARGVAAYDLCLNSRLLSLGSVGLDTGAGAPNETITEVKVERHLRHGKKHHHTHKPHRSHKNGAAKNGAGTNGTVNGYSNAAVQKVLHKHDLYLHSDLHRPTSRAGSIARHLTHMFVHYAVVDTFLVLIGHTAGDTLGKAQTVRQPGLFDTFLDSTGFIFLPGTLNWDVPRWAVQVFTQCSVPIVIWQALSAGYHAVAVLTLSTGLWEVQSWDVDLFDQPWKADSLIDLWGRRWHQVFRHQFIILAVSTLRILRFPANSFTIFPLTFLFSGLLHAIGELAMSPAPAPAPLASFFVLTGVGCVAEVLVKRLTGKRVRGNLGRIWTWVFTFFAGRIATDAWFDGGIAGNRLLPPGGVGDVVAPWLLSWAVQPYSRP